MKYIIKTTKYTYSDVWSNCSSMFWVVNTAQLIIYLTFSFALIIKLNKILVLRNYVSIVSIGLSQIAKEFILKNLYFDIS